MHCAAACCALTLFAAAARCCAQTTFLFANVLASGMKILLDDAGGLSRRNRFIVAATFACGIGVTLWPAWAQNNLWRIDNHMKDGSALGEAKLGVRNGAARGESISCAYPCN